MDQPPFIIERIYDTPVSKVWKAITDKNDMKQWYFELKEFKAEAGFEFGFFGGTPEKQYLHLCKVVEVIPEKKLAHTWRYEDYEGNSLVSFELFSEGNKTRLRLTHSGLETFPRLADFKRENFEAGWTEIIGKQLKGFVEKEV